MALLTLPAITHLRRLQAVLTQVSRWESLEIEGAARHYVEAMELLKLKEIAQPLRAALTGATVSPPVFEVMEILGRDETLARLGFVIEERRNERVPPVLERQQSAAAR